MTAWIRRRFVPSLIIPLVVAAIASVGCDIVTADLRSEESAEWKKTYTLDASGTVEIGNVNGKIVVEPSEGNTVEVRAIKKARGATPEAAKAALERATIVEDVTSSRVKIDTKMPLKDDLKSMACAPALISISCPLPVALSGT